MAVSNVYGSNIFDILFGLGLPWSLQHWFIGNAIPVDTHDIGTTAGLLALILVFSIACLAHGKLAINKTHAIIHLFLFALYWVYVVLHDLRMIPF